MPLFPAVQPSGFRLPAATFPTTPFDGDLFYETDTKILWAYDSANTRWNPVGGLPTYSKAVPSGAGSTTSTTFVDWPGTIDLAFTKYATHTSIAVIGSASCYCAGSLLVVKGLRINSVDYNIGDFFFNPASTHHLTGIGATIATGLAAGNYTARLRWRTPSGGSINADTNDVINYQLQEVIP